MEYFEKNLVRKIKEKRELSGLSDSIILEYLNNFLKKKHINAENLTQSEEKIIVKSVRADLRYISGMFQSSSKASFKKRSEFLARGFIEELLKTHSSTKERLDSYPLIINFVKELKINSILDLGCGLNPIAISPHLKGIKYYASDIREDELSIIKEFFEKNKIDGKTFVYDLRKMGDSLPKADICFLFKVLDNIETKGHGLAEKVIKTVQCRYILASFPTRKLSGKPMNLPRRIWLEKLLLRLNYTFRTFETSNEIFYLMSRNLTSSLNIQKSKT